MIIDKCIINICLDLPKTRKRVIMSFLRQIFKRSPQNGGEVDGELHEMGTSASNVSFKVITIYCRGTRMTTSTKAKL